MHAKYMIVVGLLDELWRESTDQKGKLTDARNALSDMYTAASATAWQSMRGIERQLDKNSNLETKLKDAQYEVESLKNELQLAGLRAKGRERTVKRLQETAQAYHLDSEYWHRKATQRAR